jgi:hypothetical protein
MRVRLILRKEAPVAAVFWRNTLRPGISQEELLEDEYFLEFQIPAVQCRQVQANLYLKHFLLRRSSVKRRVSSYNITFSLVKRGWQAHSFFEICRDLQFEAAIIPPIL